MSIFSSTISLTRYRVKGELGESLIERIEEGLSKYSISDIDNEAQDMAVGWTSLATPYTPDFSSSSFVVGTLFAFALRIDKKSIPSKVVKQQCAVEADRKLRESGEESLSRGELKEIKEHVINVLSIRIPPTPSVFDILWDYENKTLSVFSTQKAANEELETLFSKTFNMQLIRMFPYTATEFTHELTEIEKDKVAQLKPANFTE